MLKRLVVLVVLVLPVQAWAKSLYVNNSGSPACSDATTYANNSAALPMIDDSVKNDVSIYPTAEVKAKIVPDLAESPEFTRLLTRSWTRFKTGK